MFTSHTLQKTNDKSFSLIFSCREFSANRGEIIPLVPTAAFFVSGKFPEMNKLVETRQSEADLSSRKR